MGAARLTKNRANDDQTDQTDDKLDDLCANGSSILCENGS